MKIGRRMLLRRAVFGGLVWSLLFAQTVGAQAPSGMYVGVDTYQVLTLTEPATKVAVANPGVADVQVINPTQLLIAGRSSGVTSLVVFSNKATRSFNVIVHPSSMTSVSANTSAAPPHPVLVQRGDRMSEQLFTRGPDNRWLELGQVKPETEVKK
jgi:hypothetical protein